MLSQAMLHVPSLGAQLPLRVSRGYATNSGLTSRWSPRIWTWLRDTLHGDLGNSLSATHYPVSGLLRERVSQFRLLFAALMSLPLSLLLGAYSAYE